MFNYSITMNLQNVLENNILAARTYYGSYHLSKMCIANQECNCGFRTCCAIRHQKITTLVELFNECIEKNEINTAKSVLALYSQYLDIEQPNNTE
jgi:hypothetical protein